MADTADEYHAELVAQADEQVAKLLAKVEKCEEHFAAARAAHEAAGRPRPLS